MHSKRKRIIEEIVQVELSYHEALEIITNNFMAPFQGTNIITTQQFRTLFSDILTIRAVSEGLIDKLKKRTHNFKDLKNLPVSVQIGDLFCGVAILLKSYSLYISNFDYADYLGKKLMAENQQFNEIITKAFEKSHKYKYEVRISDPTTEKLNNLMFYKSKSNSFFDRLSHHS